MACSIIVPCRSDAEVACETYLFDKKDKAAWIAKCNEMSTKDTVRMTEMNVGYERKLKVWYITAKLRGVYTLDLEDDEEAAFNAKMVSYELEHMRKDLTGDNDEQSTGDSGCTRSVDPDTEDDSGE